MISNPSSRSTQPIPSTAGRASWSGPLIVGQHLVQVKAYAAAVAATSSLHQVHAECGARIQHRKCCPHHGEILAGSIAKAYAIADNDNIVLDVQDLARLQPHYEKSIRVEHLIPADQLDLALLSGRTLHLVPAHPAADSAYAVVSGLFVRNCCWGIGRAVLSDEPQLFALHAVGARLVLHVLNWPQQLRSCPHFGQPAEAIDLKAVQSLDKSLTALRQPFSWDEYADEFEQRLTSLIQGKLEARSQGTVRAGASRRAKRDRKQPTITVVTAPRRSRAA